MADAIAFAAGITTAVYGLDLKMYAKLEMKTWPFIFHFIIDCRYWFIYYFLDTGSHKTGQHAFNWHSFLLCIL